MDLPKLQLRYLLYEFLQWYGTWDNKSLWCSQYFGTKGGSSTGHQGRRLPHRQVSSSAFLLDPLPGWGGELRISVRTLQNLRKLVLEEHWQYNILTRVVAGRRRWWGWSL